MVGRPFIFGGSCHDKAYQVYCVFILLLTAGLLILGHMDGKRMVDVTATSGVGHEPLLHSVEQAEGFSLRTKCWFVEKPQLPLTHRDLASKGKLAWRIRYTRETAYKKLEE